ncbi:MAG TPA: DNA internalization-related competence protein ComEC/Rec2 [Alphaproteobacteria bacterium]|nr:DNA internalization-related competence protein ComEC/Rec2 [Alphaproteobacteria bacterium]
MTSSNIASGLPQLGTGLAYRHRPVVPVVLSLAVAIFIAEHTADHLLWGVVASGGLAGVGVGMALRWRGLRGVWLTAACTLVLGHAYALWSVVYLPTHHISRHLVPTPVTLEGRLLRVAKASDSRTTLDLAAQLWRDDTIERRVSGRVRVTAYDFAPTVEAGDIIRLHRVRLRRPIGFRNPGAFDYAGYLARRGIYVTASIGKAERLEVVQRAPSGALTRLSHFKAMLMAPLNAAIPEPAAAITKAMVWGAQNIHLPPDVREAFAASGTAHLMSVSGLHVGFIYAAVFLVLKGCLVPLRFRLLSRFRGGPRPSKLAAAAGLLAALGYATLVGANIPTLRATLMIATFVVAYLLDRDGDPFNTTALAALLILLLHPPSLFDIGFQLSFAGVLAILYAHRWLYPPAAEPADAQEMPRLRSRLKAKARDFIIISVCASVGTAPLILYYFQRLPLIAAPANIIVVPIASFAVPLALLASVVALLWQALGDVLLWLTGALVTVIYALIRWCAAVPYAAPRLGAVSWPLVGLIYATLWVLPYVRRSRLARWGAVAGSVVVGTWLVWPWLLPDGRGQLQVTFLDVGHGDASVIRFPHGTTMLVDGGGSYRDDVDIGERVVAPFLWHERLRRLDYVVATHPHPDHAKGLRFPLQHFRVRQFWDNGAPLRSQWYSALRQEAMTRGLYRDVVDEGVASMTIDGVRLEVLHPTAAYQPQAKRRGRAGEDPDENNRSLVLKLTYGRASFLLTGDIEQDAEAFLVRMGHDLRATVVKAPHHGSRTSSSEPFVRAVNPSVAVFSVPHDSRFGHPHPVVVERYRALGARIVRTDEHGAITVRTDGHSIWVEPYVGESVVLPIPAAHRVAETLRQPWMETR